MQPRCVRDKGVANLCEHKWYPVAYLPGQSNMEMTFESAQFDADLFALANDETFEKKTATVMETQTLKIASDTHKATLETAVAITAAMLTINGLAQAAAGATATAGEYTVGDSTQASANDPFTTEITFGDTDLTEVEVHVERTEELETIDVNNQQTFVGSAILKWPVYASGEETKAAGVKGYVLMHIYKCRVTAFPGLTLWSSPFVWQHTSKPSLNGETPYYMDNLPC